MSPETGFWPDEADGFSLLWHEYVDGDYMAGYGEPAVGGDEEKVLFELSAGHETAAGKPYVLASSMVANTVGQGSATVEGPVPPETAEDSQALLTAVGLAISRAKAPKYRPDDL